MKIVSFKICPFVQRVTAMLAAKGLLYEIEYISLKDKPQWFLDISPHGQVPILITDSGNTLFESEAIMEYIDEIAAPLEPNLTPEQRALERAWGYMAAKHYLVQCSTMRSANRELYEDRLKSVQALFSKAEKELQQGPFFKGEALSNVDIAWLPLLHRAQIIKSHSGHDLLAGFAKTQAWQASILKLGIVKDSVADDFERLFCDFYLSEQTYLGNPDNHSGNADSKCASGSCC